MEAQTRNILQVGWLDYLLSGVGSALAVFSAGYALGISEVAYIFVVLILVGTAVSTAVQALVPRSLARFDGILYLGAALVAMFFEGALNNLLPSDGFPPSLAVAGWLCWMLSFCSFTTWRDSTLLFQAVPGIALFGFIGTWDTFRASPFFFFGFLLCFATLFARSHSRGMMMRAQSSGFTSTALDAGKPGGFLRALRNGPWRWMAGPEWALLSALFVVLISLIGAPFLQFSLQGVSGFVRLGVPPTAAMRRMYFGPSQSISTNFQTSSFEAIGVGPHAQLAGTLIFQFARQNGPVLPTYYLRYHTYRTPLAKGWQEVTDKATADPESQAEFRANTYAGPNAREGQFQVIYIRGQYDSVPVPGNIQSGFAPTAYRTDGTVINEEGIFTTGTVRVGISSYPSGSPKSIDRQAAGIGGYADAGTVRVSQRMREFVAKAIAGAHTDYEKAEAIRAAIAKQCTYDINAAAVPEGEDPVDYFLFNSKRGYCDLFASSMTVLARAANLPARFVTGYANFTKPQPDAMGNIDYFDTDYHAWCEVYFKETGWTVFDATDGAREAPDAGRGSKQGNEPWYQQLTFQFGLSAVVLIGIFALALRLNRRFRMFVLRKREKKAELEKQYVDLVRMLESRTGRPRRPSTTPYEYLALIEPYLNGTYEAVEKATRSFVSTFYGSADPPEEQVAEVKRLVTEARSKLKSLKRPKDVPETEP